MRLRWLAALAILPAAAWGQTARPISLDEAVKLAQRNAPAVVQARGQIRSTDAAIRTAKGAFMPSLSINTTCSRQGGETFFQGQLVPFRGDPWNFSRGLTSNLELFDGGRRMQQLRAARAAATSAESNARLQQFRVALDVKQQYYNVLAAHDSRAAAVAQLQQAEEQLKASTARVAAGAAIISDSLRSVIAVGNAQLAVMTAENNLRVANVSLTRLVGSTEIVTALPDDALVGAFEIDSAEVVRLIDDAPTVRSANSDLSAARASYRVSRTPYLPTLTTSFSLSGSNTSKSFDFGSGTYAGQHALRFTLSYPLFNGFQREENVVRASVAEANAVANLRDARLLAEQQVAQALGTLRLARARAQIQTTSLAAATEDLRVQQQRYTLGASTLLDVLTSQAALNQARVALIQARLDARIARAQIEALLGRDLP